MRVPGRPLAATLPASAPGGERVMAGTGGRVLAWLGHPVTVLAVAVLALNDHVLKQAAPGVVTGKLSDVAGLMVAAPLLAVALWLLGLPALLARLGRGAEPGGRRVASRVAGAATILTAAGFTLVKLTGTGARLASEGWTAVAGPSRVLADPTDLVALPALGAAWVLWRRARDRPLGAPTVRLARLAIVLPAAVLAVAATSLVQPPTATTVERQGRRLLADVGETGPLTSNDGGVTWYEGGGLSGAPGRGSDCLPRDPAHCYRVVEGRLRVEESTDAGRTWRTAWELTPGRERFLRRALEDTDLSGVALSSVSLAAVEHGGGHVVVVANQRDGLLRRDVDGTWHRIGFPAPVDAAPSGHEGRPALPTADLGSRIGGEYVLGAMAAWLVLAAGVGLARRSRKLPGLVILLHATTGLGFLMLMLAFVIEWPFSVAAGGLGATLIVGGLVSSAVVTALTTASPPLPRWYWPSLVGLAVLTLGVVVYPFVGWTVGTPDAYEDAVVMAAGSGVAGAAGGVGLGFWARRRWTEPPDPVQAAPPLPR